ncbi:MAG TPA: phosphatidylinositol-specific phospholipase C domain-containing protein, partial [Ktedonobacteraceae bacterium]|nr:phosphatidylinositol-specific phospholipase C domain-containing protein [Ktedonobacteraceae bacterium]
YQWSGLPAGPVLSDAGGWNQPQYYNTIQCGDVDGDGLPELFARGVGGIRVWKCDPTTNQWTELPAGPALSDAANWNQPQYYSTIQSADIDGDGQVELLARGASGIRVWKCDGTTHQWAELATGPALSDASGWNQQQYYSTIQTADIDADGHAELLARGAGGMRVWKCDETTYQWTELPAGPALSDANNWNQPQYYSAIQTADVDGDGQAELFARASGGINVWKCDPTSYQWTELPAGPTISDADGWNQPQYYSTIQSADFDGDGQAEMLARGASGISVWQCDQNTAWIGERVTGVSTLNMQQYLGVGDYLVSPNGQCVAVVQDDGNFVVYQGSAPNQTGSVLWETGTAGQSSDEHIVTMQNDGNLVLYQGPHPAQVNKSVWSSAWDTATNFGNSVVDQATTTLQDTGELVITTLGQTAGQAASTLWSSQPTTPNWASPNWMSKLRGNTLLSQFTIPGTHDSCARKPVPYAQCQTLSLTDQLNKGIRFLDIRCRHIDNSFAIHHGEVFQDMMFGNDVRDVCISFLQAHPGECIVMSVKEEYKATNNTQSFQATFNSYLQGKQQYWYLGDQIPSLDAVRGKIVLIRRFSTDPSQPVEGIDASNWPDNQTFTITNNTSSGPVVLQVQDEYEVSSPYQISDKAKKTINFVQKAAGMYNTDWYLNFASGSSSKGLASPAQVALGVVSTLDGWTGGLSSAIGVSVVGVNKLLSDALDQYLKTGSRKVRLGTIIMDYPDDTLIRKIISVNGLSPDKQIAINNQGLYKALYSIYYSLDGQNQSPLSDNLATSQGASIPIPAAATNIRIQCQEEGTTGTGNPLFDLTYPSAVTKAFVLRGAPGQTSYNEE